MFVIILKFNSILNHFIILKKEYTKMEENDDDYDLLFKIVLIGNILIEIYLNYYRRLKCWQV